MDLPDGEKSLTVCLFVSTEYTNATDRRTDTAQWHRPRLCIASRGKNRMEPGWMYNGHYSRGLSLQRLSELYGRPSALQLSGRRPTDRQV